MISWYSKELIFDFLRAWKIALFSQVREWGAETYSPKEIVYGGLIGG